MIFLVEVLHNNERKNNHILESMSLILSEEIGRKDAVNVKYQKDFVMDQFRSLGIF